MEEPEELWGVRRGRPRLFLEEIREMGEIRKSLARRMGRKSWKSRKRWGS